MKNLNYKWVLLIGAVLGFAGGTFNKDQWETIAMSTSNSISTTSTSLYRVNHTTGEVWFWRYGDDSSKWEKRVIQFLVSNIGSKFKSHRLSLPVLSFSNSFFTLYNFYI